MSVSSEKKINIFTYIFAVLVSIGLIWTIIAWEKEQKLQLHLDHITEDYLTAHNLIYIYHKKMASIIYETHIDTSDIKSLFISLQNADTLQKDELRKKLYTKLLPTYNLLTKNNLQQLHFHQNDTTSFLRFHRPKLYGDKLFEARETIAYVMKHHKAIDGFEEGRIYSGYRFVYPLMDGKNYLGSVEISFNSLIISKEFLQKLHLPTHLFISKELVANKVFENEWANYVDMDCHYCVEINNVEQLKAIHPQWYTHQFLARETTYYLKQSKGKTNFSIYEPQEQKVYTFLQITNPVSLKTVGYFIVKSSGQHVINKNRNAFFIGIFLTLFVVSITLFVYYTRKLNISLANRVKEELKKNRLKDQHLLHQSRLAQMGEMLNMIAHQWRQPLAAIGATASNLMMKYMMQKDVPAEYVQKEVELISEYTQHLSNTIDDFRNFFKTKKQLQKTDTTTLLEETLKIITPSMIHKNITITKQYQSKSTFQTYAQEVKQVLLNLIKNSEDVFGARQIDKPSIFIKTYDKDDYSVIEVLDNGGGIPKEHFEKVFEPYFTTKKELDGTGIGLYMSKIIIEEHCKGLLSVHNTETGACFTICLPRDIKEELSP